MYMTATRKLLEELIKDYCVAMETNVYVPDTDCMLMYMDPIHEYRREVMQIHWVEEELIVRSNANPNAREIVPITKEALARITAYWEA